jgi:acetoin utilization protein AcuB
MQAKHTVGGFMTRDPFTIGVDQPIAVARRIMSSHDVRYLPVLRDGRPVGLLTAHDLDRIEATGRVDRDRVLVEEAMAAQLYQVSSNTPLVEVARTLAGNRLGAALVSEAGTLVGILTTGDALFALVHIAEGLLSSRRLVPA